MSANLKQVGGDHYQSSKQHWDLVLELFGPGYLVGNATKYVTRWRKKAGVQDLEKACHYVEKLIEWATTNIAEGWHLRAISPASMFSFASANRLNTEEERIIFILFSQWSIADLHEALGLIKGLIDANQPQADNTGMTNPRGFDASIDTK